MKRRKIGVTGATGFIGKYFLRDYINTFDFVAVVRTLPYKENRIDGVSYILSDFSVDSLCAAFAECDAVVHLAANVLFSREDVNKLECYLPNVDLTVNVFEACCKCGIKSVIYSSSRSVCSNVDNQEKVFETDYPFVTSGYGVTKLCGEIIAQFYNSKFDMKIKCFRYSDVCGMSLDGGMRNPFWDAVLNACINKKSIVLYGSGEAKRDIIYVKDVTNAIAKGMLLDQSGVYNICSGKLATNYEIAKTFCDIWKNEKKIIYDRTKNEGGTNFCLDGSKALIDLGFSAKYSLRDMVEDILQEYLAFSNHSSIIQ